jgi:hypothetical protein
MTLIEGKIKETGGRGKGRKQLLNDLKETIGCWKLKETALCGKLSRKRLVRQTV